MAYWLFSTSALSQPGKQFCAALLGEAAIHKAEDMAPVRRVPESGSIAVGPHRVKLTTFASRAFYPRYVFGYEALARGGAFGFRLAGAGNADGAVRAKLFEVDSGGRARRTLRHWPGSNLDGGRGIFSSGPLRRVGYYRFDIEFEFGGGRKLVYSEYARVLRPRLGVKLSLSKDQVKPGEVLFGRLVNVGTDAVEFGAEFQIDVRQEGQWVEVPSRDDSPWPAVSYELRPGEAEACTQVDVPSNSLPGVYRIEKIVNPIFAQHRDAVPVRAYFRVAR